MEEKMYTVEEVAEKTNTNLETVRRWIRSGKLQGVKSSKKEGYVISESELNKFLSDKPKYAKAVRAGIVAAAILDPIGTAAAAVAAAGVSKKKSKQMETLISQNQLAKFYSDQRDEKLKEIESKKAMIEQLTKDINECDAKVKELTKFLDDLLKESKNMEEE